MTAINEWSPLKKVVVGIADNARMPPVDDSHRYINHCDKAWQDIQVGLYDQTIIDQANQDLSVMVKHLEAEGVEVVRPTVNDCEYYDYCPRDSVFHHGDITIATPMPVYARRNEWKAFGHHLNNVIELKCSHSSSLYNPQCVGPNPNVLALNETEPAFDAANCLKANDHILYLVSNSGNLRGCHQLQEILGNNVKVHPLHDVYAFTHIDSTICFLREGLIMINPSRVKDIHDLPHPFNTWDVVQCPEPEGYRQPEYAYCSPWVLNMNLISINERLVMVEENQHQLRKLLNVFGIDSITVPGRQMTTLGGGVHCTTLDLDRD